MRRAGHSDWTSPSADRVVDVASITLPFDPDLSVIDWPTPVPSTNRPSPVGTPGRSIQGHRIIEDVIMEDVTNEDPAMAIGVSDLAKAWDSEDDSGAGGMLASPDVFTHGVTWSDFAETWESDDGLDGRHQPMSFKVGVSDLGQVWSSGESSPAREASPVREGLPAPGQSLPQAVPLMPPATGRSQVTLEDVAGLFDSDASSEDGDGGQIPVVQGPYTAESFAHIPDDWLAGL